MSHRTRYSALLLLAACATIVASAAAHANNNTRYLSISGNNANACTLTAPCRTLARGISATPAGGELQILDSGFYGNNATVNKSMTISGNGHTVYLDSEILVVNPTAAVALRGLVLDGRGAVLRAIRIAAEGVVAHIERCLIRNFTSVGITVFVEGGELYIVDTIARDNAAGGADIFGASRVSVDNSRFENNGGVGVQIQSGAGTIHRSTAIGNGIGVSVAFASVSIMSTVAAQNTGNGFSVTGGGSTMMVESSIAHGNGGSGVNTSNSGTARISGVAITDNVMFGVRNGGGTIETRQNNTVTGNGTNTSGVLTPIGGV